MTDFERIERNAKLRQRVGSGVTYLMLTIWGLIVLFPFYWMILTSVKSYGAYNSEYIPKFITLSPTFENYKEAFTAVPLAKYFLNTFLEGLLWMIYLHMIIQLCQINLKIEKLNNGCLCLFLKIIFHTWVHPFKGRQCFINNIFK